MSEAPQTIVLTRHRDLAGRKHAVRVRRAVLVLLLAFPVLALANVFGQRPSGSTAATATAKLNVYAPQRLRGGLVYTARFRVDARQELKDATLVLDSGWLEQMTVNEIEPSPINQGSENGRLSLSFGHVRAGQALVVWIAFSVNPTNVGHRSQDVELDDGTAKLLTVHRTITVFP